MFFLALVGLYASAGFYLFAAATCLLTFVIGVGLPFAVAEVAELDPDGRFIILSVPAIAAGAMIGPGAAGMLSSNGSFLPVIVFAGVAVLASVALFMVSAKLGDTAVSEASAVL